MVWTVRLVIRLMLPDLSMNAYDYVRVGLWVGLRLKRYGIEASISRDYGRPGASGYFEMQLPGFTLHNDWNEAVKIEDDGPYERHAVKRVWTGRFRGRSFGGEQRFRVRKAQLDEDLARFYPVREQVPNAGRANG